jgi:hypothetical protein
MKLKNKTIKYKCGCVVKKYSTGKPAERFFCDFHHKLVKGGV